MIVVIVTGGNKLKSYFIGFAQFKKFTVVQFNDNKKEKNERCNTGEKNKKIKQNNYFIFKTHI